MAQHKASESPLVAAARALDHELDEFARNADQLQRASLTTQQQIDRARTLLAGVAAAEAALRNSIAALERAVRAADVKRAEQAAAIDLRKPHIDARAAELQRLLDRYIDLGVRLTQAPVAPDPSAAALLATLADETEALLGAARRGDYPDIVRLSEALGKQVAASRAKLA